jgi:4-amino-4-deoxy-L-arabinose transferase-like glycosyltransferase
MQLISWWDRYVRPGHAGTQAIRRDVLYLVGLGLLLIATGIGLRDPWPADEPRFALVARDMVETGKWLLPTVGGDIYADKPPVFFWMIAPFYQIIGSLRIAFLLPSLLSGLGATLLVYDLARRLWNRETGLVAGTALLLTVQFVWQARQAQIDATLCFWTTLGLYGLLRHLLLGPQWRWYVIGWAAAGFGVITKGVGFLPLLVLIPFVLLRDPAWQPRMQPSRFAPWLLGPLAFVLAISVWLVPMLLAAQGDPAIAAYRDEILFRQTIDRYANAWHHREPFWYFLVNVIPVLWLPLTALLPWLVPAWKSTLQRCDLRIALLLSWAVLVVLFFSLSSGKRGVYVLPAVPAMALATAPYLVELFRRERVQRTFFWIAAVLAGICLAGVGYLLGRSDKRVEVLASYDLDPLGPLAAIAIGGVVVCLLARPRRGIIAYSGVLAGMLLVVSFWVNPVMNEARSSRQFVNLIERTADPRRELGIVAFKEQYFLNIRRPIVHFGHARWREAEQEAADAASWLAQDAQRQLIVTESARTQCFQQARAQDLGSANRIRWFLVEGAADPSCVGRGKPGVAREYVPLRGATVHAPS